MPKNESVVEMAIIKVALIAPSRKSGMVIAGRIWRVIIYIFGAPAMITPSRYGFSRSSMASCRVCRANTGIKMIPMVMAIVVVWASNSDTAVSDRRTNGMASRLSKIREQRRATVCLPIAASNPSGMPHAIAMVSAISNV